MTVPEARRDPRLNRYPLRRCDVQSAAGTLRFVTPASSGELLATGRVRARRAEDLPLWADVWPASIAVARHLARGDSLAGERVVDLGCGLGVAGVAAGVRGARVTFADREPDALAFADFNARANGLQGHALLPFDWSRDELPPSADPTTLLLLADLTYEYRNVRPLLRQVGAVLADGGRAIVADPFRRAANDFFAALCTEYSCDVTEREVRDVASPVRVRIVTVG